MSKFNNKYRIESIRIPGYDYSQPGAYFVTICTHERIHYFGDINNGKMILNECGQIALNCWNEIPNHFPHVSLDEFIIMPNHIHGIIIINDTPDVEMKNFSSLQTTTSTENFSSLQPTVQTKNISSLQNQNNFRSPSKTIGSIIRGFKIGVTKWFREKTNIYDVWQSNYYEHIIRNEIELNKIREYIINNPINWEFDKNNIDI
jgi:REP element-mobilizing transposase RayT